MTLLHVKINKLHIHPFLTGTNHTGFVPNYSKDKQFQEVVLDFIFQRVSINKDHLQTIPDNLFYNWLSETPPTGIITQNPDDSLYHLYYKNLIYDGRLFSLRPTIIRNDCEIIKVKINHTLETICRYFKDSLLLVPYGKYSNNTIYDILK